MGFVRKITGVQAQTDAANRNADAQETATKEATKNQAAALAASAKAAAQQQAQIAARSAAESLAEDAAKAPLGTAEVRLDTSGDESVVKAKNQRKASFGREYSTYSGGVNI